MVALTQVLLALSAVAGTLAAPTPEAHLPEFEIRGRNPATPLDYTENYANTYSNGNNFSAQSNPDGYSVSFNNAQAFAIGRGWSKGASRNITFSGSTSASGGTTIVSAYGWTTQPLREYYIQEWSNGAGAAKGDKVGTVTSDGSVYDIWKNHIYGETFLIKQDYWQYFSIRRDQRKTHGTINTANHFKAWAALGMDMGLQNYQVFQTEGRDYTTGSSAYTVSG